MRRSEFHMQAKDGLRLFAREWQGDKEARGVVCLVHGMGEHSARYNHVAAALIGAGFAVLAFDQRGHGKSQGKRGHTPSFKALIDDVALLLDEAMLRFPQLPCILYGHSMGGNLVLNYVLRYKPKLMGVIATAPWLRLAFEPPKWKIKLGWMMNTLWPSFTESSGLDPRALSQDIQVVNSYINDPLMHDRISARMFTSLYKAGFWALKHAGHWQLPLLIMHGDADRVTSAQASRQFVELAQPNSTFQLWAGLYHEIHNEPSQQKVFAYLIDWLNTIFEE